MSFWQAGAALFANSERNADSANPCFLLFKSTVTKTCQTTAVQRVFVAVLGSSSSQRCIAGDWLLMNYIWYPLATNQRVGGSIPSGRTTYQQIIKNLRKFLNSQKSECSKFVTVYYPHFHPKQSSPPFSSIQYDQQQYANDHWKDARIAIPFQNLTIRLTIVTLADSSHFEHAN